VKAFVIREALKDSQNAQKIILQLPCFSEFADYQREIPEYSRLLEVHLHMSSMECPIEVSSTDQYGPRLEASIVARRFIPRSTLIAIGVLVKIDVSEEERLVDEGKTYSIIKSSCPGTLYLLLGPAHWANSDCEANASMDLVGENIHIKAKQDIEQASEITVCYGKDYFGEDCRCKTCTSGGINGYNATSGMKSTRRNGRTRRLKGGLSRKSESEQDI